MIHIALMLSVFMLVTPAVCHSEASGSTPLAGQGGAKAGQETIRSGIAGQAVEEKERVDKQTKPDAKKDKKRKSNHTSK